jgi:DNA polymerase III delta subunit
MQIAGFLAGRFKILLKAKLCQQQGYTEARAVREIGGSPGAAKAAWKAVHHRSLAYIEQGVAAFSDVDFLQKSGAASDLDALELALMRVF